MLDAVLAVSLGMFAVSIVGCLYRVAAGPSLSDRIIALDTIGVNLIAIVAILSVMLRTQAYLDIILLIGILSFLGTIAFSKYLEKGAVFEHESDHRNG